MIMYQKTELDILFKALQARLDKNQIQLIAHWYLEKNGLSSPISPWVSLLSLVIEIAMGKMDLC